MVPIAAILTLTALRLVDATSRATDASRVGALTTLSANVSQVAHEVHRERMAAAALLAAPAPAVSDAFNRQTRATDVAIADYTARRGKLPAVPGDVQQRLNRIDEQIADIGKVRQVVNARGGSVPQVILRYGVVIDDLVAYREALSQVTGNQGLSDALRAAGAFSKAKAGLDDEQALAFTMLQAHSTDEQQLGSLLVTLTVQQESFITFSLAANVDQRQIVASAITGDAVELADEVTGQLRRSTTQTMGLRLEDAMSSLGAADNLMRWAEQRLDTALSTDASDAAVAVQRRALIESIVVVVVLGIVIALALVMARSMIGSLRRLRQAAFAVAEIDLPETVNKLRDAQNVGEDTPEQLARQVHDPIELHTRDEIGEVARAFNMVHREAVRVAAEQAVLRTSVSAMFLGLARRSQTLVDRMIGQLDRIERTEEDPKRLAELFQLDHLATRMRRNDENVLVLADADSTPPRSDNAPLADVMRAAQSEIDMYERVEFGTVDEDVLIASRAVNDVVRLLAELFDNGARFSPPTSIVVVEARRVGDRVLVQVEDAGLGMSPETLVSYNTRLAAPPAIDIATFRMMGLAVVGRLAHRHGITVQLRDRSGAGTIVEVLLPAAALILPQARTFRQLPSGPSGNGSRPGLGAHPYPPAGPPGVSRPAPFATVTGRGMSGAPVRTPPPVPPRWPMTANPVPAPATVSAPPENRWADLLAEPLVAGPGTDSWPLHDETTELPIFREIEAVWFETHADRDVEAPTVVLVSASASAGAPASPPTQSGASGPPPDTSAAASASSRSQPHGAERPAAAAAGTIPPGGGHGPGATGGPGGAASEPRAWRTRADEGWAAARAAAEPVVASTTRSGLPKRAPQAQLVPGGVASEPATEIRRTADEVRGLLSSYHRGVRRGRAVIGLDGTNTDGGLPPVKGNG
ncbi:sensor histidine kinase [Dactylosporangium sp. CA-092794]|uniref:sensor histidine kinase n=1 Tax=Dactylosporangium sp. CA-092794 TaxID=3239929 RepID=UPI003D8DD33F